MFWLIWGFQASGQTSSQRINLATTHALYRSVMIQLAYISTAADDLASGDIFKIIEKSARNNGAVELTGFLIFANRRFFQVIEGPFSGINGLMTKLRADPRHHSIKIVHRSAITNRTFPNWSMKRIFLPDDQIRLEELVPELSSAATKVKLEAEDFIKLTVA